MPGSCRHTLCILVGGLVLWMAPLAGLAQAPDGTPGELVTEGDTLLAAGDLGAARTAYRRAIDRQAHLVPALLGLARIALQDQQYDAVTKHASRVIKQEPDHLEARYLRGIAYREKEKSYTLQSNSLADFAFILARDSLFQDALYQYALTLAYREQYPSDRTRAVTLAERHLELKPASPNALKGLFEIYARYVRQIRWKRALRWLDQHSSVFATYFSGEILRRHGRLHQADSIFAALLEDPREMPRALILLARARIHYALEDPTRAQRFVAEAFAAIKDAQTARIVFEDFKYIVSIAEWEQFQRLRTPDEYRTFFRTLWTKRDPTPADPLNARLVEHYRRMERADREFLYSGFRGAYSTPITTRYLDFPPTYELGVAFDDRGIIYVRHGKPDRRDWDLYREHWTYQRPAMAFFFSVQTTRTREGVISGVGNFRLQSLQYQALTTDHHQWSDDTVLIDFPYTLAAFRGEDGRTRLDVYYVLPVGVLTQITQTSAPLLDVDVGLAVHDLGWREAGRFLDTKRVPSTEDASAGTIEMFRLNVMPDSFHVALHARAGQALGHYRFDYHVPDFSGPALQISDLLPAYAVTPTDDATGNGLHVLPNPSRHFATDQLVYVYFEVYGLTFAEDRTRYSLEYTLEPMEERRRFLGFLRRDDRSSLSIKSTLEGTERSPVEYGALDVSDVASGRYRLRVTVTDEHLGHSVERTREIELVE